VTYRRLLSVILMGVLCVVIAGARRLLAQDSQANQPMQTAGAQADPNTSVAGTRATLYIYRPRRFEGKALKPSVYVDDKELARIENGRFLIAKLDPGAHIVRSNDKATGISIDMKAGVDYYARIDIQTGFWKGHGGITLVAPEQGTYEVKQAKPLDSSDVRDRDLVVENANATEPAK
jgi:hypothetical protein